MRRSQLRQPAVIAWLRLVRVSVKIQHAEAEHLRRWGLSAAQFDVLAHVAADEGLTQQELADSLLVSKGNVCQLLDRMQRARLLVRRQEGRTNRLFLTAEGRRLFDELAPIHEALLAEQFSSLSPEEQVQLLGLLRKLDHALRS